MTANSIFMQIYVLESAIAIVKSEQKIETFHFTF